MSISMNELVERLATEQMLTDDEQTAALTYLENQSIAQPWFVRTMVGFGAWLASLLLIGFIAGFTFSLDGGYAVVGIVFIVAATFARRASDNDFVVQSSLAVSLAGQALLSWGFITTIGGEEPEAYCAFVIFMSAVLFVVFPDRIHRVIMVLLASGFSVALFYFWELNDVVPILGPAFAAALIAVHTNQARMIASGQGVYMKPLMNGLMLSAFGCLMLSTIYVLPELTGGDTNIYPRPWISTIALGALFLWLGTQIWPSLSDGDKKALPTIYTLMVVITVCSYAAPGILLALIVTMLGAACGHRTFVGAGIGFLAIFLATYFYGIEVTMLTKSITLVATGGAVLLARWTMLQMLTTQAGAGHE